MFGFVVAAALGVIDLVFVVVDVVDDTARFLLLSKLGWQRTHMACALHPWSFWDPMPVGLPVANAIGLD